MNRRAAIELLRRRARQNLCIFARVAWGWVPGHTAAPIWTWPLTLYCLVTEQVMRGRLDVAIVNGPPGGGKSSVLSRLAYPWAALDAPHLRAISVVHTIETLGHDLQTDRRAVMEHAGYVALIPRDDQGRPLWGIDPRNNNKDKMQLVGLHGSRAGGWIQLAAPTPDSSGAGVSTGAHPNVHLIDDVLKMGDEHTAALAAAAKYLTHTLSTRFPSNQAERLAAFAQVVDAADHTQALIDHYPNAAHVVLPMEYEPEHPQAGRVIDLGQPSEMLDAAFAGDATLRPLREEHERAGVAIEQGRVTWRDPRSTPGDLLMPELMGRARVEHKKRQKRVWLLNYQQMRIAAGAVDLVSPDAWAYWTTLPPGTPDEVVIACDPQSGSTQGRVAPDWTVIYAIARYGSNVYLLEELRAQIGTTDTCRGLVSLFWRWSARKGRIEDAGAGASCVDALDGVVTGLELVKPQKTTRWRVEYIMPAIDARQIHLPAPDAARPAFLNPAASWPAGRLDGTEHWLPRTLRSESARPYATLEPPRVWVPLFVEELQTSAKPDDRHDGLAHGVMPWVGLIMQEERTRHRAPRMPPRPSLAAKFGIT